MEIGTYRQGRRSLWDREGHVPPIFMKGASMVMSPNILEVKSFRMSTRVTATVVCCILTQILCAVSQKSCSFFVPQTLYRGSAPGPRWGPQTPSLLLCPPNNPVRSTPLIMVDRLSGARNHSSTVLRPASPTRIQLSLHVSEVT